MALPLAHSVSYILIQSPRCHALGSSTSGPDVLTASTSGAHLLQEAVVAKAIDEGCHRIRTRTDLIPYSTLLDTIHQSIGTGLADIGLEEVTVVHTHMSTEETEVLAHGGELSMR